VEKRGKERKEDEENIKKNQWHVRGMKTFSNKRKKEPRTCSHVVNVFLLAKKLFLFVCGSKKSCHQLV